MLNFAAEIKKYDMISTSTLSTATNYWNIIKHLDKKVKIDLIVMLTHSLDDSAEKKSVAASDYYGIWGDDGYSADEFAKELKEARKFKRDIIEI